MGHLCSSGNVADQRLEHAPFADERHRYLRHCAMHGARPAVLKIKRNELLWIARRLGPDADRGIGRGHTSERRSSFPLTLRGNWSTNSTLLGHL